MYRILSTILVIALTAACAGAVELKPTPVQDAFFAGLSSDEWKQAPQTKGTADEETSEQPAPVVGRKSVLKAGLLSALIPGAGEYYLGRKGKARAFFAAEALTWIGYLSFRMYGNWKEDDYIRFAATNGGAQLEGKDDFFVDMMAFYSDIDEYNSLGRVSDPDRPYFPDTPEYHWRWQSDSDQSTFRDLKNSSREAYRRSDFMIGVAIVARVISVIDAVRDAIRMNRRVDAGFSQSDQRPIEFDIDPFSSRRQVSLTLYTPF